MNRACRVADTPTPTGCNVPWYLSNALDCTHNYVSMSNGTMTWDAVKTEIDKGLVIGTRIGWNGGGGHFMVIYGVSRIEAPGIFILMIHLMEKFPDRRSVLE